SVNAGGYPPFPIAPTPDQRNGGNRYLPAPESGERKAAATLMCIGFGSFVLSTQHNAFARRSCPPRWSPGLPPSSDGFRVEGDWRPCSRCRLMGAGIAVLRPVLRPPNRVLR